MLGLLLHFITAAFVLIEKDARRMDISLATNMGNTNMMSSSAIESDYLARNS